jgi:Zn finger protein HypA/HybF involved in hydrogenase expression
MTKNFAFVINFTLFWGMTPCSPVYRHKDSERSYAVILRVGSFQTFDKEPLASAMKFLSLGTVQLRSDSTCAETRFRLSAKRTSPCDSVGATVQSTTGSRGVRVSW